MSLKRRWSLTCLILCCGTLAVQQAAYARGGGPNYAFARGMVVEIMTNATDAIIAAEAEQEELEQLLTRLEEEIATLEAEVRRLTPPTCAAGQKIVWGGSSYACDTDRTQ